MKTTELLQTEVMEVSSHLDEFLQHRLWFSQSAAADEAILAGNYWASRRFQLDLEMFAVERRIPDLAIAASLWNKNYNNALLSAVLPAMTLLGLGLEASLENISLVLKDHALQSVVLHHNRESVLYLPRWSKSPTPSIQTVGELSGLYRFVFGALFDHLRCAVTQINRLTRLPPPVMWGNAGNFCDYLYEELANCPGAAIATQTDRAMLLKQSANPAGTGRNPLYRTVVRKPATQANGSASMTLRRTCCLLFRMPHSNYCGNCPLKKRTDGETS